jgi:hypothetical protein
MAIVRILPQAEGNSTSKIITIDVVRSGKTERLIVTAQRDLIVDFGDSIRCVAGTGVALMNPGTRAGAFILTTKIPFGGDYKYRTNLEISAKTLRVIERGEIVTDGDIGTVMTATAAATR